MPPPPWSMPPPGAMVVVVRHGIIPPPPPPPVLVQPATSALAAAMATAAPNILRRACALRPSIVSPPYTAREGTSLNCCGPSQGTCRVPDDGWRDLSVL